jgi:uncharacterized protein (TIGR04222 family)
VALLALIDDGAVTVEGHLMSAKEGDPRRARVPLETDLLARLQMRRRFETLLSEGAAAEACTGYQRRLESLGYLVSPKAARRINIARFLVAGLLFTVAVTKVALALGRGHPNVGILIVMAIGAALAARAIRPRHRTRRGERALNAVRALLADARARVSKLTARGRGEEIAIVAAAFGFAVLSEADLPSVRALVPPVALTAGSSGSGSSGWFSSGGSSSCGSSCGGGGCGGGCGGCGSS